MQELDFYDVFSSLSGKQRMIWESARKFVDNPAIVQKIKECNIKEEPFPREYIAAMGNLGFLGADIKGYGCPGVDNVSYGLIMHELERRDSALRSTASVQGGLAMRAISEFGSEAQKAKWLPLLQKGKAIGCFGLTEAYGGSNPGAMQTRAKLNGDFYVLNGSKAWITNGCVADISVVWARMPGEEGIRGFLVEKGTPGFSTNLIKGKGGLRASVTSDLFLEECKIPQENLLPGTEVGLKAALFCLNHARYGIAWGATGAATSCYETALDFALNRKPFDKPIASSPIIQERLVSMVEKITSAQLRCIQLARLKDENKIRHWQISEAKRHNVKIALEVAREARNILASNGIQHECPVWTHMANLELVKTYEGAEEIHTLIVGQKITGIPAF